MEEVKKDIVFSKEPEDYEILIRKNQSNFTVFCPQINTLIKGSQLGKIKDDLKIQIMKFIQNLPKTRDELELEEEIKNNSLEEKKRIQDNFKSKLQGKKDTNVSKDEIFEKLQGISSSEKNVKTQPRTKTPVFEQKFQDLDNYFYNSDVAI